MRPIALVALAAVCWTSSAFADAPKNLPRSEAPALPLSIWRLGDGGDAVHLQSGLACPAQFRGYKRVDLHVYDGFGLDVFREHTTGAPVERAHDQRKETVWLGRIPGDVATIRSNSRSARLAEHLARLAAEHANSPDRGIGAIRAREIDVLAIGREYQGGFAGRIIREAHEISARDLADSKVCRTTLIRHERQQPAVRRNGTRRLAAVIICELGHDDFADGRYRRISRAKQPPAEQGTREQE